MDGDCVNLFLIYLLPPQTVSLINRKLIQVLGSV